MGGWSNSTSSGTEPSVARPVSPISSCATLATSAIEAECRGEMFAELPIDPKGCTRKMVPAPAVRFGPVKSGLGSRFRGRMSGSARRQGNAATPSLPSQNCGGAGGDGSRDTMVSDYLKQQLILLNRWRSPPICVAVNEGTQNPRSPVATPARMQCPIKLLWLVGMR